MAFTVQLNQNILEGNEFSSVHLMPCKIHSDGPADVAGFFTPYIGKKKSDQEEEGTRYLLFDRKHYIRYVDLDSVFEGSFRGYPLQGQKIPVPEGYTGLVLTETKKPLTENEPKNLSITKKFDSFTYWNWDYNPSTNDPAQLALDWLDISKVVKSTNNLCCNEINSKTFYLQIHEE